MLDIGGWEFLVVAFVLIIQSYTSNQLFMFSSIINETTSGWYVKSCPGNGEGTSAVGCNAAALSTPGI